MSKYIDADALKEGMDELLKSPWANDRSLAPTNMIIKEALGTVEDLCIDDMPAADVEPVEHGEWIEIGEGTECSECGEWFDFVRPYQSVKDHFHFCPNCGAKMDGGSEC